LRQNIWYLSNFETFASIVFVFGLEFPTLKKPVPAARGPVRGFFFFEFVTESHRPLPPPATVQVTIQATRPTLDLSDGQQLERPWHSHYHQLYRSQSTMKNVPNVLISGCGLNPEST
jgi:hypothetical protein